MIELGFAETALRLTMAMIFGLLIGLDREIKHKPVGVRTYMLVGLGSAAYTIVVLGFAPIVENGGPSISMDPSRLIQGLIGGIGFLGAGAIIGSQSGDRVRGAATGAAIWVVGAMGIASGLGYYWDAALITALALVVLFVYELAVRVLGHPDELMDALPNEAQSSKDDDV